MKNKKKSDKKFRWLYVAEILLGVILLGSVSVIAINMDLRRTREHLSGTISYIKEQYNQHKRLNLASETKSSMRVIQSARQIEEDIYANKKENSLDETLLKRYTGENHLSGIVVLDKKGKVKKEYKKIKNEWSELQDYMETEAVLDTIKYSDKTYAGRFDCADGSYVDLATVGLRDHFGAVLVYYHTPKEYIASFSNSVESLLTGYNLERDGTIVVSSGKEIIASNNEALIGKSTDDIEILRKIREQGVSDTLVHTKRDLTSLTQNFGLMEHGRDYYVYAYMPESDVFNSTFQNILYSLIVYIVILAAINMVRWKTAQRYREEQMRIQNDYTTRLQNKNEQLEEALDQADRANAAKTNFLSRMSHDIRTPLNGIIGLLDINERHPDDMALIKGNQKKMKISANHLLSLINDVLQMSKMESGEVYLSNERINLAELSSEVLAIVQQRADEAGIALVYDKTEERVPYKDIYGSPLHLRQIFLNIYGNCIKYNKVGGKVETSCRCICAKEELVTYQWTIRDTGIGMSEEFVAHIFEPFAQEHSDARSEYNGTGLGMAIVKNLVDKMQGTIEVTSKLGEGSTFVITLPFQTVSQTEIVYQQTKEDQSAEAGDLHLLLVEDNELNAEIAQMLLEDKGFTITLVTDGQQAVDAFAENPLGTFDAVLMDIMMPVLDGLDATKRIRAMEREDARTIPIIAMTANAFDEDVKKCMEAGMDAHLSKPLQIDQVTATILKCKG